MGNKENHETDTWCDATLCEVCAAGAAVLFSGIDPALLAGIQHTIDTCRYKRGEVIYHMGSPGEAIYTVRTGLVKMVLYLPDGHQRIVRLVRSTDVMGLEALLGQDYQHEARVEQDTLVCRIPLNVVRKLEQQQPQLYRELMRRWQLALKEAEVWLTELSAGTARQRVTRLLLRLVDEEGNGTCQLFGRPDMAAMLGLTTETVSRLIAEFKREGVLEEFSGGFRCSVARLRAVIEDED